MGFNGTFSFYPEFKVILIFNARFNLMVQINAFSKIKNLTIMFKIKLTVFKLNISQKQKNYNLIKNTL